MRMMDTHCHLDRLRKKEIGQIVGDALAVGVDKLVTVAVDPDNLDTCLEISQKFENVYCSQGVHPHDAKDYNLGIQEKIKRNTLSSFKVVAIGEIGLDYFYEHTPREVQREVFAAQLNLAVELDKPVIIHSRDAEEDTIAVLSQFRGSLKKPVVLHSFSSNESLWEFALEENFYLGLNGMMTFLKPENLRNMIRKTPLESIVLETDAPFLTPVPKRGKENWPEYIPHILAFLAQLKEKELHEVAPIVYQNSLALFGL